MEERDGCLEGTPNWRIARFGWDVFVEERDFCFEGTPNWRIARFGWMCLWKDGLLFWGDAELAHSAIPLDVFVNLWVE